MEKIEEIATIYPEKMCPDMDLDHGLTQMRGCVFPDYLRTSGAWWTSFVICDSLGKKQYVYSL